MKQIEITNFSLTYDGMYFIKWDNHEIRIFLKLNTILKMLEIEGLTYNDVNQKIQAWEPIHFSKATMIVTGDEINGELNLLTSDFSDEYLDKMNLTMIDINLKDEK